MGASNNNSKIADNIKKYRNKIGISQDKLSTIIKIESGANKNPTIETLRKVAKALDVGVDDLLK